MKRLTNLGRLELLVTSLTLTVLVLGILAGEARHLIPGPLVLGLLLARLAVRHTRQQNGELELARGRWVLEIALTALVGLAVFGVI